MRTPERASAASPALCDWPAAATPAFEGQIASKTAPAVANAWQQVVQTLHIPSYVYSDDGSEFKAEVVSRGHAYFVERLTRQAITRSTIKKTAKPA